MIDEHSLILAHLILVGEVKWSKVLRAIQSHWLFGSWPTLNSSQDCWNLSGCMELRFSFISNLDLQMVRWSRSVGTPNKPWINITAVSLLHLKHFQRLRCLRVSPFLIGSNRVSLTHPIWVLQDSKLATFRSRGSLRLVNLNWWFFVLDYILISTNTHCKGLRCSHTCFVVFRSNCIVISLDYIIYI